MKLDGIVARTARSIVAAHVGDKDAIVLMGPLEELRIDPGKLGVDVEDVFGIAIGEDDVQAWKTVEDVVAFVERSVRARDGGHRPEAALAEAGEPCLGLPGREVLAPRAIEYLGLLLLLEIEAGARPREEMAQAIQWFDLAQAMRAWQAALHRAAPSPRSEHFRRAQAVIERLTGAAAPWS